MKLLLVCLLWIAASPLASALEVRQVYWGFDGQVVPGTFNPLSVLVSNPSAVPFDGQLQLTPEGSTGSRGGGKFAAPCYLAPGASRWVQFYPYFHNGYNSNGVGWTWTLVWGRGPGSRFDLDAPTLAAPARVWLADPDAVSASADAARLKHFPDNLFPPTVSATDGLDTIVLDHVPHWEAARRAAFLDWVRRGGTLHLLADATGREPIFTDELALLNTPLESLRIGSGRVTHHHGAPGDLLAADPHAPSLAKGGPQVTVYDMDDNFFQGLNRLTRPRVHWHLLYTLTALYLLAVGPGHYFWARRQRDYRISLAALAGGVVVFAVVFAYLGRRGFDEKSRVLTLACARALDGNRYDVTQWSNVFVTDGGIYTLTHPAEYNLYSSGTRSESTAGLAVSGRGGGFHADLPLFSTCAITHRGVMVGDDTAVTPALWNLTDDGQDFRALRLTLPPAFPTGRFDAAWVRYHNDFYKLRRVAGELELDGRKIKAAAFLSGTEFIRFYTSSYARGDMPATAAREFFDSCRCLLIASSLGGNEHFSHYISRPPPPDDEADLFLFVNGSPETFRLSGTGARSETGLVMYRRTILKPQAPDAPHG